MEGRTIRINQYEGGYLWNTKAHDRSDDLEQYYLTQRLISGHCFSPIQTIMASAFIDHHAKIPKKNGMLFESAKQYPKSRPRGVPWEWKHASFEDLEKAWAGTGWLLWRWEFLWYTGDCVLACWWAAIRVADDEYSGEELHVLATAMAATIKRRVVWNQLSEVGAMKSYENN